MKRFQIVATTVVDIEAETMEQAEEIFYDGVYEVDRHSFQTFEIPEND